jgi:hypothetical protein
MFSYDPLKSILALLPRSLESAQYLSAAYVEQLTAHGIHSSAGRPGTCWDNAVPESFFAILKNELLYRARWSSRNRAGYTRRLALRLKAGKLRQEATVEDLAFRAPPGIDRSVVMNLAPAGGVAAHHNLLISGPLARENRSWPAP